MRLNVRACLLLVLMCLAGACAAPRPAATATPALQKLRIVNSGSQNIAGLSVLFPGPTADSMAIHVEFGDVPAGQTTGYREVPSGVYRYAAYEYVLEGRLVSQPVTDWVGESPMAGHQFTYRIELDPAKQPGGQIRLVEVLVDVP